MCYDLDTFMCSTATCYAISIVLVMFTLTRTLHNSPAAAEAVAERAAS